MNTEERVKNAAVRNGEFFHIEIRSQKEFKAFRVQNIGKNSGIERVGGQSENGSWKTVKWLVSKELAHIENGKLVADHSDARELFDQLEVVPNHLRGDRFDAKKC